MSTRKSARKDSVGNEECKKAVIKEEVDKEVELTPSKADKGRQLRKREWDPSSYVSFSQYFLNTQFAFKIHHFNTCLVYLQSQHHQPGTRTSPEKGDQT